MIEYGPAIDVDTGIPAQKLKRDDAVTMGFALQELRCTS
jgi:hypothetical protein